MGLSLEEMELETTELLPAREVMGLLDLSVCISVKVDVELGGCCCRPQPCCN